MDHFNHINPPMVNIDQLHRNQQDKTERRYEMYSQVLVKCHGKIKATAETPQNLACCFFNVPRYIFGVPLYDTKGCILFLVTSLVKNGFEVRYTHPNLLFISWVGKTNKNSLTIENTKHIPLEDKKPEYKSIEEIKPSSNNLVYNSKIINNIDDKLFKILNK